MVAAPALERVAARARELFEAYEPPDFAEVSSADAALFLTAVDHGTGYREPHTVDGEPYEGSALLWALGLAAERARPGLLSAGGLAEVTESEVAELFRAGEETASGPGDRARLWRDLAAGLERDYGGEAARLIDAAEGRLAGPGGLLERLGAFEAYSDPLAKKSFLVAKIWERRGWLAVADPGSWEVSADSVLMRLALRSGLVAEEDPDEIRVEDLRAATRDAFRAVAAEAEIPPPQLDDLLWERGREDPDLLGDEGGDLLEPPRRSGVHFY